MAIKFGNAVPTTGKFADAGITGIKLGTGIYKFIDTMTGAQAISPASKILINSYVTDDPDEGGDVHNYMCPGTAAISPSAPTKLGGVIAITFSTTMEGQLDTRGDRGTYLNIGGVSVPATSLKIGYYDKESSGTIKVPVSGTITNRNINYNITFSWLQGMVYAAIDFSGLIFG